MAFFTKSTKRGSRIFFLLSVMVLIAIIILSFIFLFPYLGQTVGKKAALPSTLNSQSK